MNKCLIIDNNIPNLDSFIKLNNTIIYELNIPFDFSKYNNITYLRFMNGNNFSLDYLPPNLTHLIFCYNFDISIDNLYKIVPNLTYLDLGGNFNQSVDNLALLSKLEVLIFGKYFNQSVDNLPSNIKYLLFGEKFNQPVNNLPCNLFDLVLGKNFNQNLDHLPLSLKCLEVGKNNDKKMDNLPNSLERIKFNSWDIDTYDINMFPDSIEKISVHWKNEKLIKKIKNSKFKNKIHIDSFY